MSLLKKIGIGLAIGLLGLAAAALFTIWYVGAWGIVFPNEDFETVPPEIAADFGQDAELRVLVFSKTNSFRHKDAIPAARALFDELAVERNWAVYHSENSALFDPAELARFDVVVFSNASGNMMSDEQDAAFETWLAAGGGWLGIHAAGDGSHQAWRWYQDTLIGGLFTAHIMGPQTQEARVVVEDTDHPATRGVPAEFRHEEEWYSWDASARTKGMHVLLTVDESTYEPFQRFGGHERDLRMKDHPIVWTRCVGRGRAIYSAMGHWGAAYETPYYRTLLRNATEWAAGRLGGQCTAEQAGQGPIPNLGSDYSG